MLQLLHSVEGGAGLEPFDLRLVEAVEQFQGLLAAVTVLHNCLERLKETRGRGGRFLSVSVTRLHEPLHRL